MEELRQIMRSLSESHFSNEPLNMSEQLALVAEATLLLRQIEQHVEKEVKIQVQDSLVMLSKQQGSLRDRDVERLFRAVNNVAGTVDLRVDNLRNRLKP